MSFDQTVRFNTVIVYDSLPEGDYQSAKELYQDVLHYREVAGTGPPSRYHRVDSGADLRANLDSIVRETSCTHLLPVLHIEAHGDREGLLLSAGDHVPWEDLREQFTRINRNTHLNLVVVMALCNGGDFVRTLIPTMPAPVWSLVGPKRTIRANDLARALSQFYSTLIDTNDGGLAIERMNGATPPAEAPFRILTAESMFCAVWRAYLRDLNAPGTLETRVNDIVAAVTRQNRYDIRVAMEARTLATAGLAEQRVYFDRYMARFLMLDDIPANRQRFTLAFEDCRDTG